MSLALIVSLAALAVLVPTGYAAWIGAPYAPTKLRVVRKTFDKLKVGRADVLVDLGCGDGAILLEASRRGARARGYELSPLLWLIAWLRSLGQPRVRVRYGNAYTQDLSDATIVFCFLMPKAMPQVKRLLARQRISNGRYLLAYMFPLPDVVARETIRAPKCGPVYVYDLQKISKGHTKPT